MPVVELWREGERLAKIKALSLSVETMCMARKIALHHFFAFLGAVFFVASLFSVLIYSLIFYANWKVVPFDVFTISVSLFGFGSLGFLVWNLREKRWLAAFGLEEKLRRILDLPN
ncbi:MAG: hypothetical protein ACXWSC_17235 [Bdellovibrionota bacterium]